MSHQIWSTPTPQINPENSRANRKKNLSKQPASPHARPLAVSSSNHRWSLRSARRPPTAGRTRARLFIRLPPVTHPPHAPLADRGTPPPPLPLFAHRRLARRWRGAAAAPSDRRLSSSTACDGLTRRWRNAATAAPSDQRLYSGTTCGVALKARKMGNWEAMRAGEIPGASNIKAD